MVMAGRLRNRITLQSPNNTRGSSGGIVKGWTDEATVWAELTLLKGRRAGGEFDESDKVTARRGLLWVIRYYPGVKESWRVKFTDNSVSPAEDRFFGIILVTNPDGRNKRLELNCQELPHGEPV